MWRIAVGCCVFLSGCVPAALVGTAAVGTSLRSDEGVSGVFSDVDIRTHVYRSLKNKSKFLHNSVTVTVKEGRVLLTGRLMDDEACQAAVAAAHVPGVIQVFNAIQLGELLPYSVISRDVWITTQAESALLFDSSIHALNYALTTTDKVLYVLGTAHTQFERDAVQRCLCRVKGVRKVVSYIRLATLPFSKVKMPQSKGMLPFTPSESEEDANSITVRKL
jgi:osmotically-inducible protein OsmY